MSLSCSREIIVEQLMQLKVEHQKAEKFFNDVYVDSDNYKWFFSGYFFSNQQRFYNENPLDGQTLFDLMVTRRDIDPYTRQIDSLQAPLDKGLISFSEHILKDARLMADLLQLGQSVIPDALAGAIQVGKRIQHDMRSRTNG